jgi:alpha-2-macroglobulin-like protein
MALLVLQNLPEQTEKTTQMIIEGKKKLKEGYDRLLTFETKTGGYEWFGNTPGHEALTAYGLLQFHEMKDVITGVDEGMIKRVTDWLLERRDGKGSFSMSSQGLDSFGRPPPDLSDAYILWVLTSIGKNQGLEKEITAVIEKAKASEDSYLNALVANILYNVGRDEEAHKLGKILQSHQDQKTGELKRKETSITRSSGTSLDIETTALANLAWMKDKTGDFAGATELGVKFIISSVKEGKYGSTQGTILSLKVLVEFLKNTKLEGSGTFEISIDGSKLYSIPFSNSTNTTSIGKILHKF